jgi:WD40 repeat protein
MRKIIQLLIIFVPLSIYGQKAILMLPAAYAAPITKVFYTPDEQYLITEGDHGLVKIWEVVSKKLIVNLRINDFKDMQLSSDKKGLFLLSEKKIYFYFFEQLSFSEKSIECPKDYYFDKINVDENHCLITGKSKKDYETDDGTIIWTLGNELKLITEIKLKTSTKISNHALSPDGKQFIVNSRGKNDTEKDSIRIFNTENWQVATKINRDVVTCGFMPNGDVFAMNLNQNDGSMSDITFSNPNTLAIKQKISMPKPQLNDPISVGEYNIAFDEKNNFVVSTAKSILYYTSQTKNIKTLLNIPITNDVLAVSSCMAVAMSRNGQQCVVGFPNPKFFTTDGRELSTLGKAIFPTKYISTALDGTGFLVFGNSNALASNDGKYIDLQTNQLNPKNLGKGLQFGFAKNAYLITDDKTNDKGRNLYFMT